MPPVVRDCAEAGGNGNVWILSPDCTAIVRRSKQGASATRRGVPFPQTTTCEYVSRLLAGWAVDCRLGYRRRRSSRPRSYEVYCWNCGTKLPEKAGFCFACGKGQAEELPETAEPGQPATILAT